MKNNIITKMNQITCCSALNLKKYFSREIFLMGLLFLLPINKNFAQNIFSGEPVQVVGQMNGYSTAAGSNSSYRRVSVGTGTPTDGRGQWVKTYNVQSSGGDFTPINMTGGGGNGFLFISGPSGNRFQNKWVFSGTSAASLNAVNGISAFNSGNDMGLNMNTAGRYTFVFNDAGYTQTNAKFYVAYTANAPVTVTRASQTLNFDRSANLGITTSATPSSGENIYVRYTTSSDFTTSTTVVQATGSGTSWTATIPSQTIGSTVRYYVFSSTISLASLNSMSEIDKSLSVINYDHNSGSNYSYTLTSSYTSSQTGNFNASSTWGGSQLFDGASYTIANTHTVTLNENATISGITINSGGIFVASDATPRTLTIASGGTITNSGTFTAGTGTVAFAGSGTVSGTVGFNNVTIAGGVNFGTASTIVTSLQMNSGSFINTNPPTYASGSTLIYNTTGTYGRNLEWSATSGAGFPHHVRIQNGTTVDISANGFADRAIAGNLNLGLDGGSSAGSLTMGAMTNRLTIGGNLIIGGNTTGGTSVLTLSTGVGGDIYLSGNWDTKTNGSYNSNTRAVFFVGTGTSTVSTLSSATFDFLFVNKTSGGVVSLANDMTINNNLTLNAQLVTNAFKVIIPSTSGVTANANGWVRGNLQKNIPTGTSSRTFEIGDSSVYTPVTTAYTGVTTAGNIIVRTTSGDHPQIATSNIIAAKSVNRFYSITNSGVAGGSYAVTFNFNSQDTDLTYEESPLFDIGIFNNSNWTAATIGARTTASTQATGLSTYGDFQLGEKKTSSWTGSASTDWNNAANWSFGIPTSSTDVTIPSNGNSVYPIITVDEIVINSLTISSGASLTIASVATFQSRGLTVTNEIINNGTFTIENNASLIQVNNVTNTGSGSTIVKRNSSLLKRLDYTLWSSPVASQNLFGFSPQTLVNRFYTYNQSSNLYSQNDMYTSGNPALSSSSTFQNGRGYLIRMPDNHPTTATTWTGQFSGIPNNGQIEVPLSTAGGGYTLVGNPYPSPINIDTFLNQNLSKISPTLWFWRKTNGDPGSAYETLTAGLASGGGNVLAEASETNDRYIQTGQGFFVKANTTGNLQFTNQQRSGVTDTFYRVNMISSTPAIGRLWLHLKSNDVVVGSLAIAYREGATNELDNDFDGKYINDSPLSLSSFVQGEELSVQHRAVPFLNTDVVPLSFKTNVAGTYSIAINAFDGLFSDGEGQSIYLKDNLTGSVHNLKIEPYGFSSEAGVFTSRFEIVYQSTLSISSPIFNANQVVVYKNEGNNFIVNAGNTLISNINVFDLRGRLLYNFKDINANQTSVDVGQSNQVLLLQITSKDGEQVIKKIIR
jgi:hypothetical protein